MTDNGSLPPPLPPIISSESTIMQRRPGRRPERARRAWRVVLRVAGVLILLEAATLVTLTTLQNRARDRSTNEIVMTVLREEQQIASVTGPAAERASRAELVTIYDCLIDQADVLAGRPVQFKVQVCP